MTRTKSPKAAQTLDPPEQAMRQLFALYQQGAMVAAANEAEQLQRRFPNSFMLWAFSGAVNGQLKRFEQAERCARQTIRLRPTVASEHYNLGYALQMQNRPDKAVAAFDRALALDPNHLGALRNRGALNCVLGNSDNALTDLNRALQINPTIPETYLWRGNVHLNNGRLDAAMQDFRTALKLRGDLAFAHNGLGVALFKQGKTDESVAAFENAVRQAPDFAEGYHGLGNALYAKGDLTGAVRAFDHALKLQPRLKQTNSAKLGAQSHLCDFAGLQNAVLDDELDPFSALMLEDNPLRQQKRATNAWRRDFAKHTALPVPARPAARPQRLRIGYFSADFHDHATLYLMSGLFREHDRTCFEIMAYSYGTLSDTSYRSRLKHETAFHDIERLGYEEAVQLARSHNLDIAIDLKGYTSGSRSQIFGARLAPIQINYLGFPGTLGSKAFDYIVADRMLIPEGSRRAYTENVIYLPHSYQPNDNQRAVAQTTTSRTDFGLPEQGIVFCCLNNANRIGAQEFAVWMRVLAKVDGSVLWLLRSNAWIEGNLHAEAKRHGIAPDRLIFCGRAEYAEHLARQKHADLFLDTFNYNAHTTASDALWAGLPIITKAGKQFSARVAASLLKSVGLDELITETPEQYEAAIIRLASQPNELRRLRETLIQNRLTHPLFDTRRYTRNFETGLQLAYDRYFTGKKPIDIDVADIDET